MSTDELAEIDGIKPKVAMNDEDEREVSSKSSSSKYKVKRSWDHYHCTCPAWRNQKVPVNARTCKHLKELLGEKYEAARLKLKNPDELGSTDGKGSGAKPKSKGKAAKPSSKATPKSRGGKARKEEEEEEEKEEKVNSGDVDMEEPGDTSEPVDPNDELGSIKGIKPLVYMKDGDETEVESQTSSSKYKVKRTWDHYYCTCPAWRNQSRAPTNARSCKHLASLLGKEYEDARIMWKNPDGAKPSSPSKGRKRKAADDDDDEDEDDGGWKRKPASKKAKVAAPALLLAVKWDLDTGADPTGWWVSEKLDGVRTYYDGKQFLSRLGNPFTPPQWFLDKLPKDVKLDGELFAGRGKFQDAVSIVKTVNSPHWHDITFQLFDIPSSGKKPFEDRMDELKKLFGKGGKHACKEIVVLHQEEVKSRQQVLDKLKEIEQVGGEGLMLRKPSSTYEGKRSNTLQKIKTFWDAEARVKDYAPGKGKHKGSTGALICEMESGKTFNVGTGLSDKQRRDPPKKGTIIVYRFQELTRDKVPRFPSFVGEAIDKTEPKDAEIPEVRVQAMIGASGGGDDDS